MSKSYQTRRAKASGPEQLAVPAEATIALEEIAGSAKEGLLALAVGAGLQVMQVMILPVHGFLGHLIGAGCPCGGGIHDRLSGGNERA